jgi:heme uptake protein IsdC
VKKRLLQSFLVTALCLLTLLIIPTVEAAADLSDGTYTLNYTITKAENNSVSMANDYFEKPATLFVKNGQIEMQIQINHSKWVTQFKVPDKASFVAAKIISSDSAADKRTVRFQVSDLSKPIISKIHVTVPSIDYDHDYTIRFVIDEKSIKNTEASSTAPAKAAAPEASAVSEAEKAPKSTPEVAAPGPNVSSDKSAEAAVVLKPSTTAPKPAVADAPVAAASKPVVAKAPEKEMTITSATANSGPTVADANSSKIVNPKTGDTSPVIVLMALLGMSVLCLGYIVRARRSGML